MGAAVSELVICWATLDHGAAVNCKAAGLNVYLFKLTVVERSRP